jgi:hypothetical protein
MNKSGIFNLNHTAIMAGIISASFSMHAMASAGKVEFALGGANLLRNDGSSRQISKGDEINPGDTIKTTDGRVQVRFTDGGYMSFQPNTEFKVEDYSYSGKTDGTEKAFFRLIEGGLRAITGVVGHANKPNYKVSTPVATIGIRGSEYLAEFRGKLHAHCNHGSIYVFNDQGNLILFRGQTAVVGNGPPTYGDNTEGVGARGPSNTNTAYNQEKNDNAINNLYRNGEITNPDGSYIAIGSTGGVGLLSAYYYSDGEGGFSGSNSLTRLSSNYVSTSGSYSESEVYANAINFDASGNLLSLVYSDTYQESDTGYSNVSYSERKITPDAGSTTQDKGGYGALSWLRIAGGATETYSYNNTYTNSGSAPSVSSGSYINENYMNPHFIYGSQLSLADAVSITTYQADYTFVGGTHPTDANGNVGTLTGGYLHADFGNASINGGLSLTMATNTYSASFSGGMYNGGEGGFYGGGSVVVNGGSGSAASIGVNGFFAGSKAAQAGLSYVISGASPSNITGVAGFTQSGGLTPSTGTGAFGSGGSGPL